MELHTELRFVAMPETHHDAVVGRTRCDDEFSGQRRFVDDERMVTSDGELRGQSAEQPFPVVLHHRSSTMTRNLGASNDGTVTTSDHLMAEAYAEDRDAARSLLKCFDRREGFVRSARSRGKDQMRGK